MRLLVVLLTFVAACGGTGTGAAGEDALPDAVVEASMDLPAEPAPDLPAEPDGRDAAIELPPTDVAVDVVADVHVDVDVDDSEGPDLAPDLAADAADVPPEAEIPPPTAPNYLVLADDSLADAAHAHATWRATTGMRPRVLAVSDIAPGQASAGGVRAALLPELMSMRDALPSGAPLYLVLFGDAPAPGEGAEGRIPAAECENDTPGAGGCLTDNRYGDLDGDGLPEVAVGRLPVGDGAAAAAMDAKLQAFESGSDLGVWDRRMSLYTGQANFGAQIDTLLEQAVLKGRTLVSLDFDVIGAYDSPDSAYYYTPFEAKVVDLFNQGDLMVVYIGHGSTKWTEGLTPDQIDLIHCAHRLPFLFLFACLTSDYADSSPSIAELVLARSDGPISVVGATEVSHPYANAVLAYETQRAVMDLRPPTIGEAFRLSKRATIEHTDDFRAMLDAAAEMENIDTATQQTLLAQHVDLYNLLGDPATPMKYPVAEVEFDPPTGSVAQGPIHVTGRVPGMGEGTALVTLEAERDTIIHDIDTVDPNNPDPATVQANWAKAIDKVAVSVNVAVTGGTFAADLAWSGVLRSSTWWVKVYAQDGAIDAIGSVMAPPK